MKTNLILLGALFASTLFLSGQTNQPPVSTPPAPGPQTDLFVHDVTVSPDRIDALVRFQSDTVYRLIGIDFTINGPIATAVRSRRPWQMINPFAPAAYGNGFQNVSVNPVTGRAEGIRLIGIGF